MKSWLRCLESKILRILNQASIPEKVLLLNIAAKVNFFNDQVLAELGMLIQNEVSKRDLCTLLFVSTKFGLDLEISKLLKKLFKEKLNQRDKSQIFHASSYLLSPIKLEILVQEQVNFDRNFILFLLTKRFFYPFFFQTQSLTSLKNLYRISSFQAPKNSAYASFFETQIAEYLPSAKREIDILSLYTIDFEVSKN